MPTLLEQIWYKNNRLYWLLVPFSLIYQGVAVLRRAILSRFFQQQFSVPVVVVGNITVGGVGKTPLVIELANSLVKKDLRVGIVSRGYGALVRTFPHKVREDSQAALVGDEPLLIAKRTGCPVVIDPNRARAIHYLLKHHDCDVILSDDGLQHYAMGRAIEIVVIDGLRMFGNGWCLPAGPLRETRRRITQSDFIVINGEQSSQDSTASAATNYILTANDFLARRSEIKRAECTGLYTSTRDELQQRQRFSREEYTMKLQPKSLLNLITGQPYQIDSIKTPVAAVAAIGNPHRFFASLTELGLVVHEYPFSDHYSFKLDDFNFLEEIVIMTEKDAVKCQEFARANWFYLPVEARLPDEFWQSFYSHPQLKRLVHL